MRSLSRSMENYANVTSYFTVEITSVFHFQDFTFQLSNIIINPNFNQM